MEKKYIVKEKEKQKLTKYIKTQKEWILTNGMGGYASSTISFMNTRKYHGLLVVAENAFESRNVVLAKLDEIIEIDGKQYILYTNKSKDLYIPGRDYISEGYLNIVSYKRDTEKNTLAVTYELEGKLQLTKKIFMPKHENTVIVEYDIKFIENNDIEKIKNVKLKISPIINNRNVHSLNNIENIKEFEKKSIDSKIKMYTEKDVTFKEIPNIYENMKYEVEQDRGFDSYENLYIPGIYEVDISGSRKLTFLCTTEERPRSLREVHRKMADEEKRIQKVKENSKLEYKDELIQTIKEKKKENEFNTISISNRELEKFKNKILLASEDFIVIDNENYGIIAGYHWFTRWSRDELLSVIGILKKTRKYEELENILVGYAEKIINGQDYIIPNTYNEKTQKPMYNSVDASLIYFELYEKCKKYISLESQKKIRKVLELLINRYAMWTDIEGINIYIDIDGLISSGTEITQVTWMDAKVNGIPVTARDGKTSEINALMYNALRIAEKLEEVSEEKRKLYKKMADKLQKSYIEKMYNGKYIDDIYNNSEIRPNQLFALALEHNIFDIKIESEKESNFDLAVDIHSEKVKQYEMMKNVLITVQNKLYVEKGIRTLNQESDKYVAIYRGNDKQRDGAYHQGIVWPWLLKLYVNAIENVKTFAKENGLKYQELYMEEILKEVLYKTLKTYILDIDDYPAINCISEICDAEKPYKNNGCISQAWSVAAIIEILFK